MWVWLVQLISGRLDDRDRARLRYGLGWWSPEMRPHWRRARASLTNEEDFWGHALTNVGVEWTRLDPQRGWKVLAAVIQFQAVCLVLTFVL